MSVDDEEGVEFIAGSMVPTFPFDRVDGMLMLTIYDQDGNLQSLPASDTKANEMFGVWLRRFDRYKPKPH